MVGGLPDPATRRRWTYQELLIDAERAARALAGRFRRGERVAVWAPNLPEWIILAYKTPQRWVFVDAFPLTASGKIQRFKLRSPRPDR